MDKDFSLISTKLTNQLTRKIKKDNGIFFTPYASVNEALKIITEFIKPEMNILEPSCGSCQFVDIIDRFSNLHITCVEKNKHIYDEIIKNQDIWNNDILFINEDFLLFESSTNYDIIIGNPPFFPITKKEIPSKFKHFIVGKSNIYILFILKCLELLNPDGLLVFILPSSFCNCHNYNRVREELNKYIIVNITYQWVDYIDTQQETCLFVLRKTHRNQNENDNYVIVKNNYTIFNTFDNIFRLNKLFENSTTLDNIGFNVSVGTIVWNEKKYLLTNDNTKTRLIYSGDIVDGGLILKQYKNTDKKNFIKSEGLTKPILVINRGYGNGKYKFNYALINKNDDKEYLIENHLICIKPKITNKFSSNKELLNVYENIIQSFIDTRTSEFIDLYFKNNAINTIELQTILPIFI